MRLQHILRSRLPSAVFRDRRESDLSEEQFHLERDIERLQAGGLSREDARHEVRRSFGRVEQIKQASRDARGTGGWDARVRDTRQGLRRLVRDWRFSIAAVLILGIAIGANTAILSVVNAVLFRERKFAFQDRRVRRLRRARLCDRAVARHGRGVRPGAGNHGDEGRPPSDAARRGGAATR
jgi:hypothetical protein